MSTHDDFKLCYIERCFAWFTTRELTGNQRQWGDDWNDASYEHNAGTPYAPHPRSKDDWNPDGTPRWELRKVAFEGPYETPEERSGLNSAWSVEGINAKETPWLSPMRWIRDEHKPAAIWAGTTYTEFLRMVTEAGGTVYLPTGSF